MRGRWLRKQRGRVGIAGNSATSAPNRHQPVLGTTSYRRLAASKSDLYLRNLLRNKMVTNSDIKQFESAVMTGGIPQDRYKAVWLIFFTLGLGTLLPWNFFMTASGYFMDRLKDSHSNVSLLDSNATQNVTGEEYFMERLKDSHSNVSLLDSNATQNVTGKEDSYNLGNVNVTEKEETPLQSIFNNVMTLCAMLPLLIFTCLNSFIHQRIPQQIRIVSSLAAIFLVFMVTAILVKVPMEPSTFFIITMVKIVLINSFGAILQGSLFGLAGLLPTSYTAPIMSGQGLAGTFAAVALICAIASGSELKESAFGYFITACVVILIAIGSYIMLPRLDFFCFYSMKNKREYATSVTQAEMETKVDLIKKDVVNVNGGERNHSRNRESFASSHRFSVLGIFKKIWVMAVSVCLVFTVTIGVFPSVTVRVKPTIGKNTLWVFYFSPVACFLMFNIFDWAGRSLTTVCVWPGKESRLLPFLVVIRLIFIPLLMLCNAQPRNHLPVIFAHDAWYLTFMLLFSISNGYLASLCMCFGPKKVLSHEAETAGVIMAFFLSLGLALGAILSFALKSAI